MKKKQEKQSANSRPNPSAAASPRVSETGTASYGSLNGRITMDPQVMGGKPCLRGMRVTVATITELVRSGHSREEVIELYPYLESADVEAALEYAARHEKKFDSSFNDRWAGKFTFPKPDPNDPRLIYLLERYEKNR